MAPFRVIIVGGSIVGLTLANIFEQYGIDFVVLEKHEQIAPSLGAGFSIWPNGARVLDQLGCYDALEKVNERVNHMMLFNENGDLGGPGPGMGEWQKELYGYELRFMERKHAIQTLFDNLKDKSKVYTSCGVIKIDSHPDGATVETSDGSFFHGDIVIGADGVHSRVRMEMQRCAEEDSPGMDLFPQKDAFESSWSGMFGVSNTTLGMQPDQGLKTHQKGRSYLTAHGPNGTMYWIIFFKSEKKTQGADVPRYTYEDRQRILAMYENDVIKSGYTFGDLYKASIQSSIVPLEEGVLKNCFYKRVVLVGDSWHKVNPISGLGGNHGIMSAAFLADELKSLVEQTESPDENTLRKTFLLYQQERGPAVQRIVELSQQIQRFDALDSWIHTFIQKQLVFRSPLPASQSAIAKMLNPAVRLKYLPVPSRPGRLGFVDEIKIQPTARSSLANMIWVSMFAVVTMAFYQSRNASNVTESTMWDSRVSSTLGLDPATTMQLYSNLSLSVVLSVVCVESYRGYFSFQLLSSVLPFAIASFFIGWEYLVPVYFSLFVIFTAAAPSYFPSPRTLDLAMVKALFPAYLITYAIPTLYATTAPKSSGHVWTLAHAALPVVLWLTRKLTSRVCTTVTGPEFLYGSKDLRPLMKFFIGASIFQGAASRLSNFNGLAHATSWYGQPMAPSQVSAVILDLVILVFAAFSYWDLRRVNAVTGFNPSELLFGIIIAFGVSPATTLGLLWAIREKRWEEARAKNVIKTI